jgi:hypothetical protein
LLILWAMEGLELIISVYYKENGHIFRKFGHMPGKNKDSVPFSRN